jgi:hypothetical protein
MIDYIVLSFFTVSATRLEYTIVPWLWSYWCVDINIIVPCHKKVSMVICMWLTFMICAAIMMENFSQMWGDNRDISKFAIDATDL